MPVQTPLVSASPDGVSYGLSGEGFTNQNLPNEVGQSQYFAGTFRQVATTGTAGYTLVNGTGNILTWTAPNDGALHRIHLMFNLLVTSGETGGQLGVSFTLPNGTAESLAASMNAGGASAGVVTGHNSYLIQAGSTFFAKQNTALTAGAAVLWLELWAS